MKKSAVKMRIHEPLNLKDVRDYLFIKNILSALKEIEETGKLKDWEE